MKKKILICLLVLGLGVGTATAQLGSGIVYDPTNYQNALQRYPKPNCTFIWKARYSQQRSAPSRPAMEWLSPKKKFAAGTPIPIFWSFSNPSSG